MGQRLLKRSRISKRFLDDTATHLHELYLGQSASAGSTHGAPVPDPSTATAASPSPFGLSRPAGAMADAPAVPEGLLRSMAMPSSVQSARTASGTQGSPEDVFLHFATRAVVNVLFSFLRQANRSSDTSLCRLLMEDARDLILELPVASLQKLCKDDGKSNWGYTVTRALAFLEDMCSPTNSPELRDQAAAGMLRLELAAQTGGAGRTEGSWERQKGTRGMGRGGGGRAEPRVAAVAAVAPADVDRLAAWQGT
jgi:hypothetical protein